MANVNRIFDQYDSEDYLCFRTKPRGLLLCGYCSQPYEPETHETECVGGEKHMMTVCKSCGEVSFPYYED